MRFSGTLVISGASEREPVRLPEIPRVEEVHLQISDLGFGSGRGRAHGWSAGRASGGPADDDGT